MIIEDTNPPDGSRISVEHIGEDLYITIPYEHLLIEKLVYTILPIGVFCVVSIETANYGWELFLAEYRQWADFLRLGIFTLFSLVVLFLLIKSLDMYSPQRLSLLQNQLLFDNGVSPLIKISRESTILFEDAGRKDGGRISLGLSEIKTIGLESGLTDTKLFVHKWRVKVEIAPTATLVEKRWLCGLVRSFYQVDDS